MKRDQLTAALRGMQSSLMAKDKKVVEQAADELDELRLLTKGLIYESPEGLHLTSEATSIIKAHNDAILSSANDFILDVSLAVQKKRDDRYIGWVAHIYTAKTKEEVVTYGPTDETDPERIIMIAAIEGMSLIPELCKVELRSTSEYLIRTLGNGLSREGNEDLWEQLDALVRRHIMSYKQKKVV